ncbi:MAG: TIGR02452 family protein [Desulfobacteraceae bacterium]|nr:TIGR02452 family protein [Desulfobacteraceae bacterium]
MHLQKIRAEDFQAAVRPRKSLARSSGLYLSLTEKTDYYEFNRKCGTSLYSDHIIFSPFVPVFRDDSGRLLKDSYYISFITAPAVNAGAVRKNEPENIEKIRLSMIKRAEKVLLVAAYHKCDALVLGAWGCGVFQNDPGEIADIWFDLTMLNDMFKNRYKNIVYAVFDRTKEQSVYKVFSDILNI